MCVSLNDRAGCRVSDEISVMCHLCFEFIEEDCKTGIEIEVRRTLVRGCGTHIRRQFIECDCDVGGIRV